jgi:hypothetical protein
VIVSMELAVQSTSGTSIPELFMIVLVFPVPVSADLSSVISSLMQLLTDSCLNDLAFVGLPVVALSAPFVVFDSASAATGAFALLDTSGFTKRKSFVLECSNSPLRSFGYDISLAKSYPFP